MANTAINGMMNQAAQSSMLGGGRGLTATEVEILKQQYEKQMNAVSAYTGTAGRVDSGAETIVSSMTARRIANGIVMNIRFASGAKEIFVESVDKLGDALVQAIVENRIES